MKHRRFAPLPVLLLAFALLGGLLIPTLDALAATKTTKKATTTKKAAPKTKFTLALDTTLLTVPRGSGATATVLLTRNGTFAAPVALSATARRGLTFTFDDNPLTGDDTDVTVSATPTATLGSTTITVTGKSGSTAVKLLVRVKVVAALAPGVTTTTAAPVAVVPTVAPAVATTTAAPSAVATTTVPGATTTTTVASTTTTTTTQPGVTTTTAPGVTTSTTAPAAAAATTTTRFSFVGSARITPGPFGDLVIVRRLSQTPRCNLDVTVPGPTVSFTVGTDVAAAHLSWVAPNTCTETGKTDPSLVVSAKATRAMQLPAGTLLIVRGTGAGTPIRRVIRVTAAMEKSVAIGDTLPIFMSCDPPPGPPGSALVPPNNPFVVSLAAQGQFVLNDVPAGQYCAVLSTSTYSYAGAAEDTTEPIGDSFVVIPERSSSCPKATLTTPISGPVGCYAEMVITN